MPFAEGTVGPAQLNDGAPSEIRLTKDRGLVTQDIHSRYFESAIRGNIFTIQSTGITTLQGIASPLTTGGTGLLTLYNPTNSGRAAVITRGGVIYVSAGTPIAGAQGQLGWSWNYTVGVTSTVATTIVPTPNLLSATVGASVMRGYGITALSVANAATAIRPGAGYVTSSSTAVGQAYSGPFQLEETAGDIVVPPGTYLHLMPNTTSTVATALASITYEEVVYNYP